MRTTITSLKQTVNARITPRIQLITILTITAAYPYLLDEGMITIQPEFAIIISASMTFSAAIFAFFIHLVYINPQYKHLTTVKTEPPSRIERIADMPTMSESFLDTLIIALAGAAITGYITFLFL